MGTLQAGTGCPRYPGALPSPASLPAVGVLLGLEGEATDAEVVRAVLAGGGGRYAVPGRRHRGRVARHAARMLRSPGVAEDAVQDALVRAFDRLADCREPDKFAGWLFLILRNRCFAERRRHRREGRLPEDAAEALAAPERSDGAMERREQARELELALGQLTPEQREAFVLKHVAGMAYGEISPLNR